MNVPDKTVQAVEDAIRQHCADYLLPGDLVFPDDELAYCARKFVEAAAPLLHAQALRDAAEEINQCAVAAYAEGSNAEARGWVGARGIITRRADAQESGTN